MKKLSANGASLLAASMLPALFFGFATHSVLVAVIALVIALAYAWILAFPIILLLQKRQWFRWWLVIAAGALVGGVPSAICSWPYFSGKGSGYSAWDGTKLVAYVVDGKPTLAGWKLYADTVTQMAFWGAGCALCYWLTWRLLKGLEGRDAVT
ncbi:hypothetical protein [Dyella mobilis]|uniref:Uncharacterized protein n=1 Tax=Dyella mobilis TaxID=1849582 RepID=A0ABS2KGM8_9GAMM|nr:hypothetical protein [Dyella mobilis]MBM7129533.1 hypothetical protein [Dyella mobilis]